MEKTPLWQKTWFIMLMFFVVPPVGIVLMWCGKKEWNKLIKIIFSVIFGLYAFLWSLILLGAAAGDDTSTESPDSTTAYSEETAERTTLIFETPAIEETTTVEATTVEEEPATVVPTTKQETTTAKPTTTKKETTTAKPTTTKKETTTAKPTTTKAPTTAKPKTTVNPDTTVTVYRTKSGEKYHYENPCGNGTYYAVSLAEAKRAGLDPCNKCVLH